MSASKPTPEGVAAHRKSPGRGCPPKREDVAQVLALQRALGHWLDWRSAVTGKPLTLAAQAYVLWRRNERDPRVSGYLGRWAPPPLDSHLELDTRPGHEGQLRACIDRVRDDAISEVRGKLIERHHKHRERARRGEAVAGLRLVRRDEGAHIVAGLPGTFSASWVTTVGLPGEVSLKQAQGLAEEGRFVLEQLGPAELREMRAQLAARISAAADEAAVAEAVASRYSRPPPGCRWEARAAVRHMERLLEEAATWEYVHLGRAEFTGRQELPPPRARRRCERPGCGHGVLGRGYGRHGRYCSRACERWGEKP